MNIIPKSQYIRKTATAGDMLALKSIPDKVYIGTYFETSFGEKLAGDSINNPIGALTTFYQPLEGSDHKSLSYPIYSRLQPQIQSNVVKRTPHPSKPTPTITDYENKYFNRYFFSDYRYKSIIEVSKDEFNKQSEIDTITFPPYKIVWSLLSYITNEKLIFSLKEFGFMNLDPYEYIKITYNYDKEPGLTTNPNEEDDEFDNDDLIRETP